MTCEHKNFVASVTVNRLEDKGAFFADIRVQCDECGEPFRFIGVAAGLSFGQPMASVDGLELRAPIEPNGAGRIATRARFELGRES